MSGEDGHMIFTVRNGSVINNVINRSPIPVTGPLKGHQITLAVRLKNPDQPGPGVSPGDPEVSPRANVRYSRSSQINEEFLKMLSGTVLTGTDVPKFQSLDIVESNDLAGAKNWITVRFSVNLELPSRTSIAVSGLHFEESPGLLIALSSEDGIHDCFDSGGGKGFATWQSDTSLLVLTVADGCEILTNSVVTVSLLLQNPSAMSNGRVPSLSASHAGCSKCNFASCACSPDDISKFEVPAIQNSRPILGAASDPSFTRRTISENNPLEGERNTISVALTPGVDLLPGSNVTVSGLIETLTLDTHVPVVYGDDTRAGIARFDHGSGVLRLQMDAHHQRGKEFVLKFDLINNFTAPVTQFEVSASAVIAICGSTSTGACPDTQADSVGNVLIATELAQGSVFGLGAKHQFLTATIRESNVVFGASNVISVQFMLNFDLQDGANITLTGLVNSESWDVDGLTAVNESVHLFANCSCDAIAVEACAEAMACQSPVCETCSLETEMDLGAQFRVWQPMNLFGHPKYSKLHPTGKTITGSWYRDSGSLLLELAPGKSVPANTEIVFAFILKNAKSTLPPVQAKISVSNAGVVNPVVLPAKTLDGLILGAALPPKFDIAAIKETTYVNGGFTEFEIILESNCPLLSPRSPGTRIMIYGLNVFEDSSQYLTLNGDDRYDIAKSAIAYWDSAYGRLILSGSTLVGGCGSLPNYGRGGWLGDGHTCSLDAIPASIKKQLKFRFYLKKMRDRVVDASNLEISVEGYGISFDRVKATSTIVKPLELPSATFQLSSIQESTRVFAALNSLSVSLIMNSDLHISSTITISGLVDTLTVDGSLEIAGRDAELFGKQADWTQAPGQLVLEAQSFVAAGQTISFIVKVINGEISRNSNALAVRPRISGALRMEYSSLEVPVDEITMMFLSDNILSPREDPSFYVSMISVDNQVKYAVATITVSLRANVAFLKGAKISLLGLSASTGAGMIELAGSNSDMLGDLGEWSPSAGMVMFNVTQDCEPGTLLSTSFKLQNTASETIESQTEISAQGGVLMPDLKIAPRPMFGRTLSGAATVSWLAKAARESTTVTRQINAVTFTIKPNAPIFEGSTLTISGLRGTMSKSCLTCTGTSDLVPGLGCSSACSACPAGSSCLPVFQEPPSTQIHPLFTNGLGMWNQSTGSLILTMKAGQEMPSTSDTIFALMLRNSESPQSRKAECGRQNTMQDISEGQCMTLNTSHVTMCKPGGTLGTNCDNAQDTPALFISATDVPVDSFNTPLFDVCPVCVRNADLAAVDTTLKAITEYSLVDIAVYPPSLFGRPFLIPDGTAIGDYVIVLILSNWLGKVAKDSWSFQKESGNDGPLGVEKYQPLLYISGTNPRELYVHRDLDLLAIGRAADCRAGSQLETLKYSWQISKCSGMESACMLTPTDSCTHTMYGIAFSNTSRNFYIPPNALAAGQTFLITATANQMLIDRSISASTCISTRIRPVVPVLSGAGIFVPADVELTLHALDSYDPEFDTTKASTSHFTYTWTCQRYMPPLGDSTECAINSAATFIACPESKFEPCLDDFISLAGTEGSLADTMHLSKDKLLQSFIGSGKFARYIYKIGVKVSRNLTTLPEISDNPQFQNAPIEGATLTFSVRKASVRSVSVTRCDAIKLGRADLCQQAYTAERIGSGHKIVLHAGFGDDSFTSSHTVEWSTNSELGTYFIDPHNVLTSIYSQTLILKAGAILPGQRVSFRATLTSEGMTAFAEIDVYVNVPPIGGILQISPTSGVALVTDFVLGTRAWTTDSESLPLKYRFFVHAHGVPTTDLPISFSERNEVSTQLPPGNVLEGNELKLSVEVIDVWGSGGVISVHAPVALPPTHDPVALQNEHLMPYLQRAYALEDHLELPRALALASGILNAIADVCQRAHSDSEPVYTAASCARSKPMRLALRHQLLDNLMQFSDRSVASGANLHVEVMLLRFILDRPNDVSMPSAFRALQLSRTIRTDALSSDDDVSEIVHVLGYISSRLLAVAKRQDSVMAKHRKRFSSVQEFATVSSVDATSLRALVEPVVSDQKLLTDTVMSDVSGISALSVKIAVRGARPSETSNDAYTITTWRVAASTIALSSPPMHFEMEGVKAILPSRLLNNLGSPLEQNAGIDVMLVAWNAASNPVPGAIGPFVGVEVRSAGSQTALPLAFPMVAPVRVELAITRNISKYIDPVTGQGFAPLVHRFDRATWDWTSSRDELMPVSSTQTSIRADTRHLSFFSALQVSSGCDAIALSPLIFDHCTVCGGDNSTCSGCDWIPNSGRDRLCSGHGRCGVERCSCVSGWFGVMCQNFCRDETFCSGHGQCTPQDGLSCTCDEGWETRNAGNVSARGPFCTREPGSEGALGTEYEAEKKASLTMILATSIPVATFVLIVACIAYWYVTRQAREAAALRKTILDFGQSHSHLEGGIAKQIVKTRTKKIVEESPSAIVVAPSAIARALAPLTDEDAEEMQEMQEDDHLRAEASFSYGPNSGYLAQAVAATTKTNIGQFSFERIDRRTKVMRNQMLKRQTVAKYAAPKGTVEETGWLENGDDYRMLENGAPVNDESVRESWHITHEPEWIGNGAAHDVAV